MGRWARVGRSVGRGLAHVIATLAVLTQVIGSQGMTPPIRPDLPMPSKREEYRP